jgi:hypothetical protein
MAPSSQSVEPPQNPGLFTIAFAIEFNWDAHPQFDEAMKKLQMIVDNNVLHR